MIATKRLPIIASICLSLSACSMGVDHSVKHEFKKVSRGPANAPYKSITNFSSALRCMDSLMLHHKVKNIPILLEAIEDKTDTVNAGTRDMLVSALSEMTIRSHGVKVIAYGKDATNLISYMKSSNRKGIFSQRPVFDIQGSITQHDESIVNAGKSLGVSVSKDGGIGAAKSTSLSTISLDLNVIDTKDMSVMPGVSSRNSIAILKSGKSFDADASIKKLGVYYDVNLSRTEGKSQALRNLVELGAIELVGKLVKLPYWRCLGVTDKKIIKVASAFPTHDIKPILARYSPAKRRQVAIRKASMKAHKQVVIRKAVGRKHVKK